MSAPTSTPREHQRCESKTEPDRRAGSATRDEASAAALVVTGEAHAVAVHEVGVEAAKAARTLVHAEDARLDTVGAVAAHRALTRRALAGVRARGAEATRDARTGNAAAADAGIRVDRAVGRLGARRADHDLH